MLTVCDRTGLQTLEKKIFQLIITRLDDSKIVSLEYEEHISRLVKYTSFKN
jgi:hypothetical protein